MEQFVDELDTATVRRIWKGISDLKLPTASGWLLAEMAWGDGSACDKTHDFSLNMIQALVRRDLAIFEGHIPGRGRVVVLTDEGRRVGVRLVGRRALSIVA